MAFIETKYRPTGALASMLRLMQSTGATSPLCTMSAQHVSDLASAKTMLGGIHASGYRLRMADNVTLCQMLLDKAQLWGLVRTDTLGQYYVA